VGVTLHRPDRSEPVQDYVVTGFVADRAWLMTPAQVDEAHRAETLTIVDVRSAEKFDQAHIGRAVNLDAFAIKARPHWRDARLVLVDEGFAPERLLEQAMNLRARGFTDVRVLDGGLASWIRAGLPVEGASSAALGVATISPADYARASATGRWKVIEVGGGGEADSSAVEFARVARWEEVRPALDAQPMATTTRAASVLVIAPEIAACARIEQQRAPGDRTPVFYLAGGRRALDAFRAEQTAIAHSTHERTELRPVRAQTSAAAPCNTCGK